jgi:hypothetical protein
MVEIGFIMFLFYSNLLMGEFEGSGLGQKVGFFGAIRDIFTVSNFSIAAVAAVIGYVVFEFLRRRSIMGHTARLPLYVESGRSANGATPSKSQASRVR